MQTLKLKYSSNTNHPIAGILVYANSILEITTEISLMGLQIDQVQLFGIERGIYFLKTAQKPVDTRNHTCFYLVNNKLFLPFLSELELQLNAKDWIYLFSHHYYFMHPKLGMYQLDNTIDWEDLFYAEETKSRIIVAEETDFIPQNLKSIYVSIDETELEDLLKENSDSFEEEWKKNLPFNIQKIIDGNKKELEKYLEYIEKFPEKIGSIGLPLDTINSAYNSDLNNNFRFGSKTKNSFLYVLYGIVIIVLVVFAFGRSYLFVNEKNSTFNLLKTDNSIHIPAGFDTLSKEKKDSILAPFRETKQEIVKDEQPKTSEENLEKNSTLKEKKKDKEEKSDEKTITFKGSLLYSILLFIATFAFLKYRKTLLYQFSLGGKITYIITNILILTGINYFVVNNLGWGILSGISTIIIFRVFRKFHLLETKKPEESHGK